MHGSPLWGNGLPDRSGADAFMAYFRFRWRQWVCRRMRSRRHSHSLSQLYVVEVVAVAVVIINVRSRCRPRTRCLSCCRSHPLALPLRSRSRCRSWCRLQAKSLPLRRISSCARWRFACGYHGYVLAVAGWLIQRRLGEPPPGAVLPWLRSKIVSPSGRTK